MFLPDWVGLQGQITDLIVRDYPIISLIFFAKKTCNAQFFIYLNYNTLTLALCRPKIKFKILKTYKKKYKFNLHV